MMYNHNPSSLILVLFLMRCITMYLIDEKRCHKFPWIEDIHDLADNLIIGCLGEVGFKADIRELWFRGDVNRPVSSLEREPIIIKTEPL